MYEIFDKIRNKGKEVVDLLDIPIEKQQQFKNYIIL